MIWDVNGSVCLVGDIHGEYYRKEKLAENYVFLGDIGFGFNGLIGFCHHLDKWIPDGINIYFIRGNHDDPSYWRGYKAKRIKEVSPRFNMVQDYDVLLIDGKKYLCVGGGISIDRYFRTQGKSYWDDEHLIDCPKEDVYGDIYGVLSHTGFVPPMPTHKHEFQRAFPDVNKDCQDEQKVLYDILHLYKPKVWYNGHYHVHCSFDVEECDVHVLDIEEHLLL